MTAALRRRCAREPIRDEIVARILDGRYPAGTRLKELALAAEFGVSQAPVREALRELEALHLVEAEHYRGTRVRAIDLVELGQAYELRLLIEQAAVRAAAPFKKGDLDTLEAELDAQQRAAIGRDNEAYMACSVRFHRKLVEMSGNVEFLRVWDQMHWDVRVRIAVAQVGRLGSGMALRRKLLAALRAGDAEKALQQLAEIMSIMRAPRRFPAREITRRARSSAG